MAGSGSTSYVNSPHYNFYNNPSSSIPVDTKPFQKTAFEKSPLGRVIEQGGIGSAYQPDPSVPANGKTVKMTYGSNGTNEVFKWSITDNGNFTFTITRSYYPSGFLSVQTATDQAGL